MKPNVSARVLGCALGALLVAWAPPALAHWCNCLWASGYNLVVRPAQDSVTVPTSGSATVDVFVQNNMGYPLLNFVLNARATGYTVSVSGPAAKVQGYLMPGEKLRRTLTISKSGGGTLAVQNVDFYVSFGNSGQSGMYGTYASPHNAVAVKRADGTLVGPAGALPPLPGIGEGNSDQGLHLQSLAHADFGTAATGLDALMEEYCAGRGSWDAGGGPALVAQHCQGTQIQTCPAAVTRTGLTKYEAQHLWSAPALVGRKNALGAARIAALRARLQCGWRDAMPGAKYMAAFALGYLGEDAGARTFLQGIIDGTGSTDDKLVAKASLLLMGNAADKAAWGAEVTAGLSNASDYVAAVCAGALGIVDRNDTAVANVLLAKARWVCPGSCDTPDDARPFFVAHILSIVSWDRRGYAPAAADVGDPSYFSTGPADTVAPKAPTGVSCTATNNAGTLQAKWSAVTEGVDNLPEGSVSYRVYWDNAAHATCTKPGDPGCNYAHLDPTSAIFRDYATAAADGAKTFYFRITAVDAAGNESAFSPEVNCTPRWTPVARLTCTPSSGPAPLEVSCDGSASSDNNGAATLATWGFKLDANPIVTGTAKTANYTLAQGGHVVILTVTDSTSLSANTVANVTVGAPVGPDAGTPGRDAAQPGPDAAPAGPDAAAPGTDAGTPGPDAGPTPDTGTMRPDAAAPGLDAAAPGPDAAAPGPDAAQPGPDASAGEAPTAVASATPTNGPAPLAVQFDSAGSSDPQGLALTYAWSFDDGATGSGATASHTYSAAGTYYATLTVTNSAGLQSVAVAPVEVKEGVNRPPDLSTVSATPLTGSAPLDIAFNASGVTDPDGDQVALSWDFGDGQSSTEAQPHHVYAAEGVYTARLSAQDDGLPAIGPATKDFRIEVTQAVQQNRAPDCSAATVTPASGKAPLQVSFDATACTDPDGDTLTFQWSIPTSLTTADIVFDTASGTYTFPEAKSATLTLRIRDDQSPALECTREFGVEVQKGATTNPDPDPVTPTTVTSGCACGVAGDPWAFGALLALAGLLRGRRRG